ncbi:putative phytanoyl-CoA dioxygenase [Septoria linicola]|nr:putative phytanoyl-CoA dioxygenase [Septoria linicola]
MGSIGQLDQAQEHMKREGWCVVPDVLTPQETKEVLDELWSVAAQANKRGEDTFLPFLDPNESNVRVFYLLEHAIFRKLIQHDTAVKMVKSVLGEQFLISNFTANIARPGSKSMGLHSDQSLVTPDPWTRIEAMNVIWCLTDVYFENGATLYIPGSNKWQRRGDIPKDAKEQLKPFEAKAGSIVVMDGTVWHTSGANVTQDQDRALLFAYYTAPHLRQQVNWTRKLSPEVKECLSPEMEECLGLGVTANLGEAILHLKYLDDQFAAEGENQAGKSDTAAAFAKSSHDN